MSANASTTAAEGADGHWPGLPRPGMPPVKRFRLSHSNLPRLPNADGRLPLSDTRLLPNPTAGSTAPRHSLRAPRSASWCGSSRDHRCVVTARLAPPGRRWAPGTPQNAGPARQSSSWRHPRRNGSPRVGCRPREVHPSAPAQPESARSTDWVECNRSGWRAPQRGREFAARVPTQTQLFQLGKLPARPGSLDRPAIAAGPGSPSSPNRPTQSGGQRAFPSGRACPVRSAGIGPVNWLSLATNVSRSSEAAQLGRDLTAELVVREPQFREAWVVTPNSIHGDPHSASRGCFSSSVRRLRGRRDEPSRSARAVDADVAVGVALEPSLSAHGASPSSATSLSGIARHSDGRVSWFPPAMNSSVS